METAAARAAAVRAVVRARVEAAVVAKEVEGSAEVARAEATVVAREEKKEGAMVEEMAAALEAMVVEERAEGMVAAERVGLAAGVKAGVG